MNEIDKDALIAELIEERLGMELVCMVVFRALYPLRDTELGKAHGFTAICNAIGPALTEQRAEDRYGYVPKFD